MLLMMIDALRETKKENRKPLPVVCFCAVDKAPGMR